MQTADGAVIRLQSTQVGHRLEEGDRIMLGKAALLVFGYEGNEQGLLLWGHSLNVQIQTTAQ